MSDRDVIEALDAMEWILESKDVSARTFAAWQTQWNAAIASAERGPGWAEIAQRARLMSKRVDLAMVGVMADRDAVSKKLHQIAAGRRALKGYAPARR
jgi:hypothetical protein